MSFATDFKFLINIENQDLERRLNRPKVTVHFRLHIDIRNAFKPLANTGQAAGDCEVGLLIEFFAATVSCIRRRSHTKKRRLHRTGWYFERLQKKSADAHSNRKRHKQDLKIPTGSMQPTLFG